MVAEMLHVGPGRGGGPGRGDRTAYTSGNPYETVELLNALRRDGRAGRDRRRVAVGHRGRARAPGPVRGGRAAGGADRGPAGAVAAAGGGDGVSGRAGRAEPAADRHRRAGGRGGTGAGARRSTRACWWWSPGRDEAVRFRHDRIREAILGGLDPQRRRALQLAMARRLAEVPELFAVAAEQYLPVVDAVDDAAERASGGGAAAARRRPGAR